MPNPSEGKRFYGKYRGMVLNNVDPMQQGRIQVQVPDVSGLGISSWAMPCLPAAGIQNGLYTVPPIGSYARPMRPSWSWPTRHAATRSWSESDGPWCSPRPSSDGRPVDPAAS